MLTDAFHHYLARGATRDAAPPLVTALEQARLVTEAELLARYARDGVTMVQQHARTFVGPVVPEGAALGDRWFDTCDLSTMILLPFYVDPADEPQLSEAARARVDAQRSWFALDPVRAFQYRAFLATAPLDGRFGRDGTSDELSPVTHVTCGQAGAYLFWFGKFFTDSTDWQAARAYLSPLPWATPAKEWVGESGNDASLAVALTPDTIDGDPEESEANVYPADATPEGVTFRARVPMLYGLQTANVPLRGATWGVRGRLARSIR